MMLDDRASHITAQPFLQGTSPSTWLSQLARQHPGHSKDAVFARTRASHALLLSKCTAYFPASTCAAEAGCKRSELSAPMHVF